MSATVPGHNQRRPSRWLQFSLRTLLLVMLAAGIGLGWWSERVRRLERERKAVLLLAESPSPYGWNHNPLALVQTVNYLQSLGKREAIHVLRRFAREYPNDGSPDSPHQTLVLVVPLLFDRLHPEDKFPRPTSFFRNESEYESDLDQWPFRLAIQDDIPFQNVVIGMYTGAEADKSYLIDWAERQGRLRQSPLRPADDPLAAADRLIGRLRSEANMHETGSFVAASLRQQAAACLVGVIEFGEPTAQRFSLDDDELWQGIKQECKARGIRWSEGKQEYVATKATK